MKIILGIAVASAICGCVNSGEKASYPNECPYKTTCAKDAAACQQTKASTDIKAELKDSFWIPEMVSGQGELKTPTEQGKPLVFMHFDKNLRINGNSGDNLFGGDPSIGNDGSFKADKLFSTKRMGPNSKYEMIFLTAITSADKICLTGDTLALLKGGEVMVKFSKTTQDKIFFER